MHEHEAEPVDDEQVVAVTVVRSGGFAGLTRRWGVRAPGADAEHWIALVDDCPWDACEETAPDGADRFTWSLHATLPHEEHHAALSETQASGPWRTLIDAVRAASSPPAP